MNGASLTATLTNLYSDNIFYGEQLGMNTTSLACNSEGGPIQFTGYVAYEIDNPI
jgi:hypothetical protein